MHRRGLGTYVSDPPPIANPISEALDFQEMIEASGFKASVQIRSVSTTKADAQLATDLCIPSGTLLLRADLVFLANDTPVIYVINSFPAWVLGSETLAETLAHPEMMEPFYTYLADKCHQPVVYHVATLWAELVREFESAIANYEPNAPMLVVKSIGYNAENLPVFQSVAAYPDRQMQFRFSRKLKGHEA